jgi:hypothetical protein
MARRYGRADRNRAHQKRAGGGDEGPSDGRLTGHLKFSLFLARTASRCLFLFKHRAKRGKPQKIH